MQFQHLRAPLLTILLSITCAIQGGGGSGHARYGAEWACRSPTKTASHPNTRHRPLASLVTSSYLLCFPCIRTPVSYLSCFPYYAKTRGYTPTQKCRRADIFDFSPDFSHFPIARHLPASEGG